MEELDLLTISKLNDLSFKKTAPDTPISTMPLCNLYDASRLLLNNDIHRLPLIDANDNQSDLILYVMTPCKIVRFIAINGPRIHPDMDKSIEELGIGTYDQLESFKESEPLIHILELFLSRNISAVPIVDEQDRVLDVFEKYDVFVRVF